MLHITEVLGDDRFDELHLCEQCAHEYLNESPPKKKPNDGPADDETDALNRRECPHCGIRFIEFRNSGRLGCPQDYDVFAEELTPLLESIHGEAGHAGKTPRGLPHRRETQSELTKLRRQLQVAVNQEAYEEAARLRDQIRILEQG
jgi:protein arginine kinase activator